MVSRYEVDGEMIIDKNSDTGSSSDGGLLVQLRHMVESLKKSYVKVRSS